MSTAIVYAYIPEGFVIGADGRRTDLESAPPTIYDNTQKIFAMRRDKLRMVYAWSGATTFAFFEFGFKEFTDRILLEMDFTSLSSFPEFVSAFCKDLNSFLLSLLGPIRPASLQTQPPQVLFVAYFEGKPWIAELVVNHTDLMPRIERIECLSNMAACFRVFSGSKTAYFKFVPSGQVPSFASLGEGSILIRDYIKLCFVHPDKTETINPIGGHIHIGQLKPNGFLWVDSPFF
jgi:hypothetical protein